MGILRVSIGVIILSFSVAFAVQGETPECQTGSFSSYLAGMAVLGGNNYTEISIINPTPLKLRVMAGVFSAQGRPITCKKGPLGPNGMVSMVFRASDEDMKPFTGDAAVIKIVSYLDLGETATKIEIAEGIVGFQRHHIQSGRVFFGSVQITESNLAAIPQKVLEKEIETIKAVCSP
jgi:hypothetical protein